MPGVGKTTLANKLLSDQSVVYHFDIRAKTCVSQQYTRKNVLLTILSDLIGENAKLDKEAENALAEMLRKKLSHVRYLIFIDDIWHTSAWDDLYLCFPDNNNGSRIILDNFRHCDVASYATLLKAEKSLEDIANDYLENLVGRNLITVAKKSFDGKIKACRIHDLLLEFWEEAKQENFLESVKGDIAFDPSHVFLKVQDSTALIPSFSVQ
ncbi:hypothetical protein HAX54_033305 [Datura stramonium]|uniref:NB-ARC domain-containing protein n=1 Tax=Datura stramonium TaxID=4076 RepID=A0ABS8SD63_DATST|nr:hypothetical protein [Datura stramonium]